MFTDPIAMSLPKAKRVRHYDAAGVETVVPDDQWMLDFIRFTDPDLKVRGSAGVPRSLATHSAPVRSTRQRLRCAASVLAK